MLIARFAGGLGNQMFQYAAAYACASRLGVDMVADVSAYDICEMHQGFELIRIFDLPMRIAEKKEIAKVLGIFSYEKVKKTFSHGLLSRYKPKRLVFEPHFHYWPGILSVEDGSFLDGYWQSERYFDGVAKSLRELFRFKYDFDSVNLALSESIFDENSVSLHVRRGDYFNNPNSRRIHAVDLSGYYKKAIEYVSRRVSDPVFYVFSDDHDWVLRNVDLPKSSRIVKHNIGPMSYVDMWLMSVCKNNIMANSSFSWWGAWLNESVNKIVTCPRQWFTDEGMKVLDPSDVYPKNAVLI